MPLLLLTTDVLALAGRDDEEGRVRPGLFCSPNAFDTHQIRSWHPDDDEKPGNPRLNQMGWGRSKAGGSGAVLAGWTSSLQHHHHNPGLPLQPRNFQEQIVQAFAESPDRASGHAFPEGYRGER